MGPRLLRKGLLLGVLIGVVDARVPSAFASGGDSGTVSVEGVVERLVADDFVHRTSQDQFFLLTDDGQRIPLDPAEGASAPSWVPGSRMRVTGSLRGRVLAVTSALRAAPATVLSAPVTPGAKKVAVVLLNFQDAPVEPWTPAEARDRIFTAPDSVNAYYQELSGGAISLTGNVAAEGDVLGWYTIPYASGVTCDFTLWSAAAQAAAAADGSDLSGYDYRIYAWAPVQSCGFAGFATVPGHDAWLNVQGLEFLSNVARHELGHDFGVNHASTWMCTDAAGQRVPLSQTCVSGEYGDPFDVMGGGLHHMSNWHKGWLGFLDAAEFPAGTTRTIDSAGTFTLTIAPQEQARPGTIQAVRILDPTVPPTHAGPPVDYSYVLEFRQPFGLFDAFAPTDAVVTGVSIRVAAVSGGASQNTHLVDMTPDTLDFADSALAVGQTFHDARPCRALSITTLGVVPDGATVSITLAPDDTGPSAPSGLSVNPLGPMRAFLRWEPSSDEAGVAVYHVMATTPSGTTEVGTTDRERFIAHDVSGATVTYTLVAEDQCGNLGAVSDGVSIRFPDPEPAVAITSPEDQVSLRTRNVHVKAAVSHGPIDRIELYLDGTLVRTKTYSRQRPVRRIGWVVRLGDVPSGPHFVTVRAVGASGNGAAGLRVTKP